MVFGLGKLDGSQSVAMKTGIFQNRHSASVFVFFLGSACGNASPMTEAKSSDSADVQKSSDSSKEPVSTEEMDSSTETTVDTSTHAEDSESEGSLCVHPEVVMDCNDGWCRIPAGCFTAGSPVDELWHGAASEIQNQITLTHSFEIQQCEVTQEQWVDAGFIDPSFFGPNENGRCATGDCPLENINWYEAVAFANRISELHDPPLPACYTLSGCIGEMGEGMTCESIKVNAITIYECKGYRLPTMYESEYAFRAGTATAFYSGDMTDTEMTTECTFDANLDQIAWYCRNSENRTHPIGQKERNAWGLYDMAGNVFEWVDTQFNGRSTGPDPVTDPIGPTDVPNRHVLRGGAISAAAPTCRAARNFEVPPEFRGEIFGTRLARTLE